MITILGYKSVRFLFQCHCFREQVHFRSFVAMKHSPELSMGTGPDYLESASSLTLSLTLREVGATPAKVSPQLK